MKKIILILIFGMLLLSIVLVSANGSHESGIEEGKKLVESNISCNELSDEQLEAIGDYYMEQMHPGEAHELMHDMMGGHDSELIKEMHTNMAKGIYCDEDVDMMGCGMMNNRMMGMMQGGGMMGNNCQASQYNNPYLGFSGFGIFFYVILTLLLIVLILVIILLISKSKNGTFQRRSK